MAEAFSKYGEVFTVPVGNKRMTFLIGPTASVHFFRGSDEVISQKEVYEFNVPTFGKGVVFDVDHRLRREQFKVGTKQKPYLCCRGALSSKRSLVPRC